MAFAPPASAASDLRRLADALTGTEPLNWVITGDSITHGLVHTNGGRSYAEHLHELVRGELARTRDAVINTAISGHRLPDILGDFERRVSSWRPDVVTLMIGTNDMSTLPGSPLVSPAEFAASLHEFVSRTRALFRDGRPLCDAVRGRLGYELRATWLGGTRILDRLEDRGYDMIRRRPSLGAADAPWLAWRMVSWPMDRSPREARSTR